MFSALKRRWIGRQDDAKLSPFPSGVAAIGQEMQTKFSKGVQYNSKLCSIGTCTLISKHNVLVISW